MQDFELNATSSTPRDRALDHLYERMQTRRDELETRLQGPAPAPDAQREVERLDVALRWAQAGHYGTCSVCGDDLPKIQLEHDPTDMVCTDCHEASARSRRRRGRARVDAHPLSLVDGPDALTRGFARASALSRG